MDGVCGAEAAHAKTARITILWPLRSATAGPVGLQLTWRARLRVDSQFLLEGHWYEAHGIGRKEFKIKRFLP